MEIRTVAMLAAAAVMAGPALTAGGVLRQAKPPAAAPVLVLETARGTIEIAFFPADAPKSVEHIVGLVRRSFYRGQRFHRVIASLVQFGDPRSRDMSLKDYWGSGGSGRAINVFELSTRVHVRGTVGLGHAGNPLGADSQLYIMKAASPSLNGKHAIIGQVRAGMAVVDRLQVEDMIKDAYLKGEKGK